MTAQVLRVFTHEYNAVEVARQERELAARDYQAALCAFGGTDPAAAARLQAASDRKNAAWDVWWALTRGH